MRDSAASTIKDYLKHAHKRLEVKEVEQRDLEKVQEHIEKINEEIEKELE